MKLDRFAAIRQSTVSDTASCSAGQAFCAVDEQLMSEHSQVSQATAVQGLTDWCTDSNKMQAAQYTRCRSCVKC